MSDDDWDAVAKAISARLAEKRLTQMEVASRAQISLTTFRELQHNLNPRKRRPQTLAALSVALQWPPDHLSRLLNGGDSLSADAPADDNNLLTELRALREEVSTLTARVEAVERRQELP